jgi:nicotinamidase/pyrazinamidase
MYCVCHQIGTTGHAVYPTINEAIQEWSEHTRRTIRYIHKGMNPLTEMYSAMCAEVPLKSDIATNMNTSWMEELRNCDRVY